MKNNITPELAAALVSLQGEMKAVNKDSTNPYFKSKYADLATVRENVQPLLEKHKLALIATPSRLEDGENGLTFFLIHEGGGFMCGEWKLTPTKANDPQALGSATTYLRRYGDMAMLGMVADEDDDGNAASASAKSYQKPSNDNPVSAKQLNYLKKLAQSKGFSEKEIDEKLRAIATAKQASASIEKLMEMK